MLNRLSDTDGLRNSQAVGLPSSRTGCFDFDACRRPVLGRSEPPLHSHSKAAVLSIGCWNVGVAVRDRPRREVLLTITPARQPLVRRAGLAPEPTHGFTARVELNESVVAALFAIAPLTGSEAQVELSARLSADPEIRRLAWAILSARVADPGIQELQRQALCLAIATRLPGYGRWSDDAAVRVPTSGLPKWRLKRVREFVEANIAHRIRLADLASTAGLTKMYFAAQFKAAQGVSPHEYVLQRRIARAQELMASTDQTLVEIAFEVGFQTQAHFTTVFKRFVGNTPHSWRVAVMSACRADRDRAA